MLSLLFIILFFWIFGRMMGFAFRASWEIMKIMFTLVFLPLILFGLLIRGLVYIALPVLLVVGLYSLIKHVQDEV
ncbi:MAG: hypothetical protein J6H31_01045 [Butyrivibrio sp.]|nr:hypothetical protein [Butyrivibrio sp.]